jgi:transcription-repair coupling factor (superfamily II helicase)
MDATDAIARSPGRLVVGGAPEGHDARIAAQAAQARGGVVLQVARDDAQANAFVAAVRFFDPSLEVLRLPAWDCLPYDRVSPAPEIAAARLSALSRLARLNPGAGHLLVVTTGSALAQHCPPRAVIAAASFDTRPGDVLDQDRLSAYLAANGYARAATVREPGDYAIRGGVIDVFAPGQDEPVRLDLFGDQLESIRAFDPETQRSTRQLKAVSFAPVSEALLDDASVARFRRSWLERFGAAQGDPLYETVSAKARRQGVEHWLPLFYDRLDTLMDYVGPDALVLLDSQALSAASERWDTARDHYVARMAAADPRKAPPRLVEPHALYLSPQAVEAALAPLDRRTLSPFTAPHGELAVDAGGRAGRSFAPERQTEGANVYVAALEHMRDLAGRGLRVALAAWTEGSAERLAHVFQDHGAAPPVRVADAAALLSLPLGVAGLAVLPLERGFETGDLALISEQDLLGDRLARPRKRRKAANVLMEASALVQGDLIVHIDHGIGRYEGLRTLDVNGAPHDCLELVYAGGDKLFLPVENIELVTRYGSEDLGAALDKLGGASWQGRKARAKKRLMDMAETLIAIAAAREARTTEEIGPPEGLWDEFCARFPYEETEDQLGAIEDVLSDFAAGKPMDRLICGDVGFGKTEVALRAAFIMAMTGRQVAVVCPTTLLARQHLKTFQERFRGLPIRVRGLSRLIGSKETAETKKDLAEQRVEIVVGTHAILAKDVTFRDLGLLIVDEEQHFGVKHKERLKEMRADMHVLTLSATPIPRTLQMSLSGIRELSIIATPPVDRLAVRTYVTPWDPMTVREALLREKHRGGQAFIVTPRIADLEDIERFLRDQVPEISFITGHGQMAASQLEDVMTAFYDGRYDVLVSTTIVESGLDIPRANTLIVNRADMFGLSQLYQLRGRVGRSKVRAYAYLTTPPEGQMTLSAERRLKVLHSLDSLGAGFMLASHDLDLRGGGNLLGEEQSGHIKEVGVELYQQMLEEAVAAVRDGGEPLSERSWSPSINIGVAVLIPEEYVPDLTVRLSLYRRLADLETDAERDAFAAELADRFGPLPEEARQLVDVAGLKAACRKAGIAKLDAGPKGAVLTFKPEAAPDPARLVALVQRQPALFKLRPDGKLVVMGDWSTPVQRLKGALRAAGMVAAA